jgi:signal transduction histidine kinase
MPEKQLKAVETASEAGEYMIGLVQDLLESSRLESGLAALEPVDLDPREVVDRAVKRLRYQIDEKGIDVRIEALPRIRADEDAFEKVLMNLIGNAISYIGSGPEKRIVVSGASDGERVALTIEDTGIGIPEEARATIFEKFRRGPNVLDTSGTGLGLAIVKGIVEAHGGRVELRSEVGRGSAFRIDFEGTAGNDLIPSSGPTRYESADSVAASTDGDRPAPASGEA